MGEGGLQGGLGVGWLRKLGVDRLILTIMLEDINVSIDNLKVNFIHGGQGEAVVLLPGWPCNYSADDSMLGILAKTFEVFALNLPGFGCSEALPTTPTLSSLVDFIDRFTLEKGLTKFYLIGASFGGMLSLVYAARYPEKVNSVVAIAPPVKFSMLPLRMRRIYHFIIRSNLFLPIVEVGVKFVCNREFIFKRLYYFVTGYRHHDAEERHEYLKSFENIKRLDLGKCVKMFLVLKNLDIRSECREIKRRTLILAGTKDGFVGDSPKQLSGLIAGARVEVMPAEHWDILGAYTIERLIGFLRA